MKTATQVEDSKLKATTTKTTTTVLLKANIFDSLHPPVAMLPTSIATSATTATTTLPKLHFDSFNASIKTLFNKTLAKIAKTTNFSDLIASTANKVQTATATTATGRTTTAFNNSTTDSFSYAIATDITNAAYNALPTATAAAATTTTAAGAAAAAARHIESSTFPAQTVATFITGNKNRATTIIVYPTVSPESIVIPIVSCIFGFPILALLVICCLRRRAKLARERDRRRNYDMQDHAVSLVRFSPIHRLNYRSSRAISLRPERSLSQGFTSLELDTVLEERCSDVEQTQTELLNTDSPMDTTSYKMSFSS